MIRDGGAGTNVRLATRHLDDGVFLVELSGEVDICNAPWVHTELRHVVKHGEDQLIVALDGLSYIDCSGLAVLVELDEEMRSLRRRLCFVCSSADIRRILKILSLDDVLDVCDDLESALSRIQAGYEVTSEAR